MTASRLLAWSTTCRPVRLPICLLAARDRGQRPLWCRRTYRPGNHHLTARPSVVRRHQQSGSQPQTRLRGLWMRCTSVRATVVAAYGAAMSRGGRWRMASVSVIRPDATRVPMRASRPLACRTTRPSRTTTHSPAYRSRSRSETGACDEGRKSRQRRSRLTSSTISMYPESVWTSTVLERTARQRPRIARTSRPTTRNGHETMRRTVRSKSMIIVLPLVPRNCTPIVGRRCAG